jgi:hypothetical protein
MKNWKTSAAGISGGLLLAIPQLISWYQGQGGDWKQVTLGGVVALLGVLAKDFNISNAPNPTVAQNVNAAPVDIGSAILKVALIALLPACMLASGCAWFKTNQPKLQAVGDVALKNIALDAFNIGLQAFESEVSTGFDGSASFDLQKSIRADLPSLVSSDKLKEYLNAWNTAPTAQLAALVPPNLSPASAQQTALVIADSVAAAVPAASATNP